MLFALVGTEEVTRAKSPTGNGLSGFQAESRKKLLVPQTLDRVEISRLSGRQNAED